MGKQLGLRSVSSDSRACGVAAGLMLTLGVIVAPALSRASENPTDKQYLQIFVGQFALGDAAVPAEVRHRLAAASAKEATDPSGTRWLVTGRGLLEITGRPPDDFGASGGRTPSRKLWTGKDGLPITAIGGIAVGPDGWIWLGTENGAISFHLHAAPRDRWFYFWGRRYVSDNRVLSVVAERHRAWIRTLKGISLIEFKPTTLEEKSAAFLDRIRLRHNRYGYVADSELTRPGDLASNRPAPTDNDGLWTSIYVAAECFRYGVTRSPEALANARASLAALVRLETITGIPGFPARALIRRGDYREPGGEWHWTSDNQWEWKGDTSSDELVGHFFAYSVAYDLLPDEADRQTIRPVVARIAGGLLDHGLRLIGYGGRVTTWGNYTPAYFATPDGREDKALDSLEILSHLRVAWQITGEKRFADEYLRIARQLGYAQNVAEGATETPLEINYSDEELAFLSVYPLLRIEAEPDLRQIYRRAVHELWRRARTEQNPLWNFIYGTSAHACDADRAVEALERIPMDTISWTVRNSQRADLEILPAAGRFGEKQSRWAIPPNERRVMKWNGNPFALDGGDDGRSEDDGAFFLLPYWLARYHHLL